MYVHNCYVNILVCPQSLCYVLLQEMSLILLPFRGSCTWWLTLEQCMARGRAGALWGEHGQTPPKPSDPYQQQHEDKPLSRRFTSALIWGRETNTSRQRAPLPTHLSTLPRHHGPQRRDILQNTWAVLLKNVKVMQDKERTWDCHRLEEAHTMHTLGRKRGHQWKIGGIWRRGAVSFERGGSNIFSIQSQYLVVNIWGFVSHVVSFETPLKLLNCHCCLEAKTTCKWMGVAVFQLNLIHRNRQWAGFGLWAEFPDAWAIILSQR